MQLNYKYWLFFVLVVGFFESKSNPVDSLRTEKIGEQYYVIHRVDQGETLYRLSKRYNAPLSAIIAENNIINNQIALGQELRIPIDYKGSQVDVSNDSRKEIKSSKGREIIHEVSPRETLYAISRKYAVEVYQIKKWNQLTSNEISIGQKLIIHQEGNLTEKTVSDEALPKADYAQSKSRFSDYYVQTGDLIESIARKFNVKPDSIMIWNSLPNTYLSIGQKLLIRGEIDNSKLIEQQNAEKLSYGQRKLVQDQSGFVKVIEEGIAKNIDDVSTEKYLALHRSLPIGSLLEVRNLMNNQKIFVRVVGKLPATGLNENVLIRLTPVCFERLGIIDPKTRVEVSYYK